MCGKSLTHCGHYLKHTISNTIVVTISSGLLECGAERKREFIFLHILFSSDWFGDLFLSHFGKERRFTLSGSLAETYVLELQRQRIQAAIFILELIQLQ